MTHAAMTHEAMTHEEMTRSMTHEAERNTAPVRCWGRLRARTTAIDDDVFRSLGPTRFVWWRDGRGLMADGVALRVPANGVDAALAAIEVDGAPGGPGVGPVAVGALPFEPAATAQAEMVIPARLWTRDAEGRAWYTEVSGGSDELESGRLRRATTTQHLGADMTEDQWAQAVDQVLSRIDQGGLDKVVLARAVTVAGGAGVAPAQVVARLVREQPRCYVFAVDGFVGASPELLVQRTGDVVRCRPMAGTVPRNDHDAVTSLRGSAKDRWEHALVVDAVTTGLNRFCRQALSVSEPQAEPFADLSHMVTDVVGRLSAPAPSALELALALHPTPAVAGAPTDAALALIAALETRPRGLYGGPVGWVDANGDGEFAVALRCAQLDDAARSAVLYAGAGIVAGSRWQDEWRETEVKLEPMRRALGITDHYVAAGLSG